MRYVTRGTWIHNNNAVVVACRSREQAKGEARQGVCILAGLSERGPWRLSLFLTLSSLLDEVHQSHRSHAQTAHRAHTRSSTPDRYVASHRQRSGSKQYEQQQIPCPVMPCVCISSELRAGRRRFDGRCFRCSKTGTCALHTGHAADYEEGEHWQKEAGDGSGAGS
jgi:hypothetical protein